MRNEWLLYALVWGLLAVILVATVALGYATMLQLWAWFG